MTTMDCIFLHLFSSCPCCILASLCIAALKDASERVLLQCYSGPHGKVVSHEDSNSGGMISKDGVDEQDTDMVYGDDMEACDDANLDDRETNVIGLRSLMEVLFVFRLNHFPPSGITFFTFLLSPLGSDRVRLPSFMFDRT